MAKKIFRSTVCAFSKELRQRQVIRGLGFTAVASLVITAQLQEHGKLHTHFSAQVGAVTATIPETHSILSGYTPQTVAAVSQAESTASSKSFSQLPDYWSIESVHIKGSFDRSAEQAGLTHAEAIGLQQIFSEKINFKQLHPNDQFKVIAERIPAKDPSKKQTDKIIAAEFISGHNTYTAIRYKNPKTEQVNYYQANGASLTTTSSFLRYPTHYTRIGSNFSLHRLDPITGVYHSHPGIDFDAPMNTPIVSTAEGTIHFIAYEQGYGNVVKINHLAGVSTLYGHMSHFASPLHVGSVVKKGQVIGYVGMTGYATGPHVHYELHFSGNPTNPLTAKLPALNFIAASQKASFLQQAKKAMVLLH